MDRKSGEIVSALLLGVFLAGCYTLRPAGGTPEVGTKIAFDVNDAGRVGLGGALGPEVSQVEGRLLQRDSAGYLLAITNIRLLKGGEQVWGGEQVLVRPDFVGNTYRRRFSLGRSIGFGVVGIGGFAAFLASRSLFGFGEQDDPPPDDTSTARLGRP